MGKKFQIRVRAYKDYCFTIEANSKEDILKKHVDKLFDEIYDEFDIRLADNREMQTFLEYELKKEVLSIDEVCDD